MATLRQIVNKSVQLKAALDSLEALQVERGPVAANLALIDSQITATQASITQLRSELQALINEP